MSLESEIMTVLYSGLILGLILFLFWLITKPRSR